MTPVALALVLAAAVAHATWNLLAKQAGGGVVFVWLYAAIGAAIYAPLALGQLALERFTFTWTGVGFMVGSGVLHTAYFVLLQRGYREGDLSLVYPVARGTAPVLSVGGAIALFGERPTAIALAGGLVITAAVYSLAGGPGPLSSRSGGAAVGYAVATGALIAAYTLWDKHAVGPLDQPPILYYWAAEMIRALLLAPVALLRRDILGTVWRRHRREALGVGLLGPLAYILVLFALESAPVSYVAPLREVSILFGAAMGAQLLNEGHTRRRLLAATAIVLGVVALAVG